MPKHYRYLFLLLSLVACQPKAADQQAFWGSDPIVAHARLYADSARSLLPLLREKHAALVEVNEFEAVKTRGSHDQLESNLANLESLLDSLLSPGALTDRDDYKQQLQVQADYLKALYLFGKSTLTEGSYSLGTWEKAPVSRGDSSLSPVGRSQ
jgi:hypothetical protein